MVDSLTITNGRTPDGGNGGGIYNVSMLTIANSVLSGNQTGDGADQSQFTAELPPVPCKNLIRTDLTPEIVLN